MARIVNSLYLEWAKERELVRLRKEGVLAYAPLLDGRAGALAYTRNKILRDYRFCNVNREDDRVTRWLRQHVYGTDWFMEHPEKIAIAALCRFVNQPSTIGELLNHLVFLNQGINLVEIVQVVTKLSEDPNQTVWRPAYMVRSETNKKTAHYGKGKIAYVCHILQSLMNNPMGVCKVPFSHWRLLSSREKFTKALEAEYGFGSFMAGQVAADLAPLMQWKDNRTWAPIGPGAIRGMNIALGADPTDFNALNRSISEEVYLEIGRVQLAAVEEKLDLFGKLTLHDVASNVNCETSKYARIQAARGPYAKKPRARRYP